MKPSARHSDLIGRLAVAMLQYQKPADAAAMTVDLALATAHIPADMLAQGIERWRKDNNRWPQASDLFAACHDAEREGRRKSSPAGRGAYADRNEDAHNAGKPGRICADGRFWMMNDRAELKGCRADGSVIEPRFDQAAKQWTADERDLPTLTRQYLEHNRRYRVCGRFIVEPAK